MYLRDRGYTDAELQRAIELYDLHYTTRGRYRYRIIIPVYSSDSKLQTWTARSILPDAKLRYDTLSTRPNDRGDPVGVMADKQTLLGLPLLWTCDNPRVLVLCEGPFDAIRVTILGERHGVYGTCLFGLNISGEQVSLLEALTARFERLVLLLDPEAALDRMRISGQLVGLPVSWGRLPDGAEDPGALSFRQGQQLINQLAA
jgi:hypothetical protein